MAINVRSVATKYIQAFQIALSLLTIIPSHLVLAPIVKIATQGVAKSYQQAQSISPAFYVLVGGVIFILLAIAHVFLQLLFSDMAMLVSALVLLSWVGVTGAIHIDGLCDSTDAWWAAHRQPDNAEHTLAIFKDPCSGPMANTALFFCLSLKAVCLFYLEEHLLWAVFAALIFSRFSASLSAVFMPYARAQGLAEGIATSNQDRNTCIIFSGICFVLFFILIVHLSGDAYTSLIALVGVMLVTLLWNISWKNKIGGYTGDTLGAQIELCELTVLLCFLVFFRGA